MTPRLIPALVLTAVLGAACSGGSDSDSVEAEDSNEITEEAPSEEGPSEEAPAEESADSSLVADLPQFLSDFDRVCATQVGYGGATPLSDGPGPHPVVLMQETDSGSMIESAADLPAGWAIETDLDFDDNSEIVATELVACSTITAKTPNGTNCELEADDGSIIPLALVDVSYELNVYAATSGELVGTETIEAADTECPFFVFVDEGQTDYFNTPDADQYINALKAYVAP